MPRLDERIPEKGFPGADSAMQAFLDWTTEGGLTLYAHQEEALLELFAGNHLVLDTPTGSGKSLVATALHFKTFAEAGRSIYTAPIKALVSEKFFALCEIFGAEHVGMMTGDGAVNRDAPILCCTAEILANMALREGDRLWVKSVVMDEFHYYADRDRGMAWQLPLLLLRGATFLLMSATLGDTRPIREDLALRTGKTVAVVDKAERPVPLRFEYSLTPVHETLDHLVRGGKAPVYIVHFSQRAATETAGALMSTNYCTKEEKHAISDALGAFRFDSPFGSTMQRFVRHGVGLHHAGLLPRYRMLVEKLAQQGLLKVICGTDTLGVGINVPIRTVLFTQLCKYDGQDTTILKVRDFKQIAGRAGRAGFDTEGFVVAQAPAHVIENQRIDGRLTTKKKKVVKAQPPKRGYKHWDQSTFELLAASAPEPLESRFAVDHGRLLTVMQHAQETSGDARGGMQRMLDLIEQSHEAPEVKSALALHSQQLFDELGRAGVLLPGDGDTLHLDPDLQQDFSLHHSLSLFLLQAEAALMARLDDQAPSPDNAAAVADFARARALSVVSLTEAILENPMPVLVRQAHRERGRIINALKEAGIPYEERMEAIEEVTWPRPLADFLYEQLNAYVADHPWVQGELIRPKSVVRDIYEEYAAFAHYVADLGIQRSEGVLLRYLTEAYKALWQNIPEDRRSDELDEVLAFQRAMLARVDSSLVTEWESMLAGKASGTPPDQAPPPVDISLDKRSFLARIRAELHALVRALSRGDWEEAVGCVRGEWVAADFEQALADYIDEYGTITFDHRARLAHNTHIQPVGPHQWTVKQVLIDDRDDNAWSIDGRIDLRGDTNPQGVLVEILSIGE